MVSNAKLDFEPEKQIFLLLDILVDILVLVGEVGRDDTDQEGVERDADPHENHEENPRDEN